MSVRSGTIGGTGVTAAVWAFVWASPGMAIEAVDNIAPGALWFAREIDMWPQTLGLPGLVAGVLFSVLLWFTEGRRALGELSLPRSAARGAASGLAVGALVVWGLEAGLSDPWALAAGVLALATWLGVVAGVVTPLLFRFLARRRIAATS